MTKPCEWKTRRHASTRSSKIPPNQPSACSTYRPDPVSVYKSTCRTSQALRPDRVTILPQRIEATSVMAVSRCGWATNDPLYIAYHDREWGSPLHDDRGLFELLILEGAQAGLSWITILRRRESYRSAFDDFEPSKVAGYGERKLAELLDNPGIIRN